MFLDLIPIIILLDFDPSFYKKIVRFEFLLSSQKHIIVSIMEVLKTNKILINT